MPPVQSFITIPSDAELRHRKNWARKKDGEYTAVRHQLLVIEKRETKVRNGPVFSSVPVPVDINVTDLRKRVTTITATSSVSQTIESTLSVRLTQEIASAIKSGLKTGSELGVELGAEVQSRVGSEIVETVRTSLAGTTTYSVSESKEESRELTYKVPKGGSEMQLVNKFVLLRRCSREIYIVRSDVMTVRWTSTFGFKSRKYVVEHTDRKVIPLFRVIWHEPQVEDYGMNFGDYKPDVDDDTLIEVIELSDLGFAPDFGRRQPVTALDELAEIAFPTTFAAFGRPSSAIPAHRPVPTSSRRAFGTTRRSASKRSTSARHGSSKRSASAKHASSKHSAAAKHSSSKRSTSAKHGSSKRSTSKK